MALPIHVRAVATADADGRAVLVPDIPGGPGAHWVISRMIAAVPVPDTGAKIEDAFGRVVASGWDSPDVGEPYVYLAGAAGNFSVNGAAGVIAATAAARQVECPTPIADPDIYVLCTGGSVALGARDNGVMGRVIDATHFYALVHQGVTVAGDTLELRLFDGVAWTAGGGALLSTVTLAVPVIPPCSYRLAIVGGLLEGKVWTTLEPPDPQVTAIDLALDGVGGVAVGQDYDAAIASSWDNLLVTGAALSPTWDAFLGDVNQLINIIDSSITPMDRWIPQLVNGQPINPGDALSVVARDMSPGAQAVLSLYLVEAT